MEQKELKVDAAAVGRETLQERQPGEDLDEALLRSCKKLYGESGAMVFQAMQSALKILGERAVDRETALRHIAEGQSSVSISTHSFTTHKVTTTSMNDLSPEVRAEVDKALAEGKNNVVFTKTFRLGRRQPAMNRCAACGFDFTSEFSTCPQCGKTISRSFWSRLFER